MQKQIRDTRRYAGWANRATWNVSLLLNDDYDTYKQFRELLRTNLDHDSAIEAVKEFSEQLARDGFFVDEIDLADVNCDEIVELNRET